MRKIALVLFWILLACGCASGQHRASTQAAGGQDKVGQFLSTYVEAFNLRDFESLMAHYSSEAVIHVLQDGEGYVLDREGLAAALEMKRSTWERDDTKIVGRKISRKRETDKGTEVAVVFSVQTRTWSGSYPVDFVLQPAGGGLVIVKENGS